MDNVRIGPKLVSTMRIRVTISKNFVSRSVP